MTSPRRITFCFSLVSRATLAPNGVGKMRMETCSVSNVARTRRLELTRPVHIRDAKLSRTPQNARPTRYSSRASVSHQLWFATMSDHLDVSYRYILRHLSSSYPQL